MDTDSFIVHADFARDIEKIFDTLNYTVNRPLPTEKNRTIQLKL